MSSSNCPHCGHAYAAGGEDHAGIVDCNHCDRSFAIFGRYVAPSHVPSMPSDEIAPPGDAPLASSAGIAVVAAAILYASLTTPLGDTYLGELLQARGWVPYVIVLFSLWALVILAFRLRTHRERLDVLQIDLLPRSLGQRIDTSNALVFRGYLQQLSALKPGNPLIARLDWALRRICAESEPADLTTQLSARSQLDADALDSSYTMLRVLIWAIPILGFIGTVLGISEAVSGFSDSVNSAASLEVMRESIGSVTTGLGVAFDTTLLALVMSIAIMFPMSALQRAEEDLLTRFDSYCDLHLSNRLAGKEPPRSGNTDESGIAEQDRDLHSLIERLETRISRLEPPHPER